MAGRWILSFGIDPIGHDLKDTNECSQRQVEISVRSSDQRVW